MPSHARLPQGRKLPARLAGIGVFVVPTALAVSAAHTLDVR